MTTAAGQLRRLLQVIPVLADGEEHAVADVAALVGADPDTLLNDLRAMSQRDDEPAGFVEAMQITWTGKKVSLIGSDFLRPMRLTSSEVCALELGLAVLQARHGPDGNPAATRARERLAQLASDPEGAAANGNSRHVSLEADGDDKHLSVLSEAQRSRRKVTITYQGGSSAESRPRTISPYSVIFASGQWYVVACCDDSEGLRFFRLDRIEDASPTDGTFEVPSDFSLDDVIAREKLFRAPAAVTATVRYSPAIARWIAEREKEPLEEDGSLTLEHHVADMQWLVRHVLQYGPDAEVVAPADARAAVAASLDSMGG